MDIQSYMTGVGRQARADTLAKNRALTGIADLIARDHVKLLAANALDLQNAQEKGLDPAAVDRLRITEKSIAAMADGLRQIAALPDPIGEITDLKFRPSGIQVGRMRVPLGVIHK